MKNTLTKSVSLNVRKQFNDWSEDSICSVAVSHLNPHSALEENTEWIRKTKKGKTKLPSKLVAHFPDGRVLFTTFCAPDARLYWPIEYSMLTGFLG